MLNLVVLDVHGKYCGYFLGGNNYGKHWIVLEDNHRKHGVVLEDSGCKY